MPKKGEKSQSPSQLKVSSKAEPIETNDTHQEVNSPEMDDDGEIYHVERIVAKRINEMGNIEYFVKWDGYTSDDNTWEPHENILDENVISDFEQLQELGYLPIDSSVNNESDVTPPEEMTSSNNTASSNLVTPSENTNINESYESLEELDSSYNGAISSLLEYSKTVKTPVISAEDERKYGISRGLEPETIIGATDSDGELKFLIKWKELNEADLIPARIANIKWPQAVIKFYQERLTFSMDCK